MIKINLLADRKQVKAKTPSGIKIEGGALGQSVLLVGILLLGVAGAAGWWWKLERDQRQWVHKHEEADRELKRLEEVRKKGEQYTQQKELLTRKIDLITSLKKNQEVPVHILDQVSRSLPDLLWLEKLNANNNRIDISGKATNYNAVSNFYSNLTQSGYFADVSLGRTFEVPEGVAFSLSANFSAPGEVAAKDQG